MLPVHVGCVDNVAVHMLLARRYAGVLVVQYLSV